jgi:ABC-type branched-subunit amino acid transport system substrate-binding protein
MIINSSPGLYSDYVYDNIITLSKAINDCEDTICVKDKLYNIDYIGTTGRIRFDLYGDRLQRNMIYIQL